MQSDTLEERYALKFYFKLGKNATETYGMLQTTFGVSCTNRASVFEWNSYETIKEMKVALTKVIDMLTQKDFHGAFQKLLEMYNKCITAGGDDFEKCPYEKSLETYHMHLVYIYIYIYIYIYSHIYIHHVYLYTHILTYVQEDRGMAKRES